MFKVQMENTTEFLRICLGFSYSRTPPRTMRVSELSWNRGRKPITHSRKKGGAENSYMLEGRTEPGQSLYQACEFKIIVS